MASDTVSLNVKVKASTKAKLMALADDFGMTTTALVNALIAQTVRTGRLNLDLYDDGEPTQQLIDDIREARADYAAGEYEHFDNVEDMLEHLHAAAQSDKAK